MIGKDWYFKIDTDPDLGTYFVINDEHGKVDDNHIADKFPDFAAAGFYEEMESVFSSPMTVEETRAWLLKNGFIEFK